MTIAAGGSEGEPDLQGNLKMLHLVVVDVAARLGDFEPTQPAQRLRRAGNRHMDRVVDALFRRTDDLNNAVDMVVHRRLPAVVGHQSQGRWANTIGERSAPDNDPAAPARSARDTLALKHRVQLPRQVGLAVRLGDKAEAMSPSPEFFRPDLAIT